jgi:murein DD-endopeptidase MepM/ murein hydrolase activator NlpD
MKKLFRLHRYQIAMALSGASVSAYSQMGNAEMKQDSIPKKDVSTIVYELPYLPDKNVMIAQGYNGLWSHKGENALDFWMRKGQIICAAREGVVLSTKSDSKKGGPFNKYINDGNYIIIKHNDSTSAAYWHLEYKGVLVKAGDSISAGQPIGKVGSTGFSSGPHLHFEVYYFDRFGKFHTVKTVFKTKKGIKKPKAWRFYKRPQ